MPSSVDLYGTAYGNFAARAVAEVRQETYGEDFGQSSWVTADEYRRFFARLELRAGAHVLDVGCGSGGPALFLARETGCHVTGVDVSEPGIREAESQARAADREQQLTFLQADVCERLPFDAGPFDAIVCLDVLCHLRDRGRVFEEWHRVLRPGGRVLVTDPVVVTGLVSKDELAVRSSTGHFEFCPPGVNEQLLRARLHARADRRRHRTRSDGLRPLARRSRPAGSRTGSPGGCGDFCRAAAISEHGSSVVCRAAAVAACVSRSQTSSLSEFPH